MEAFDDIADALAYTVDLAGKGHGYIVNILGADEAEQGQAATVQVIAKGMIFGTEESGLALHLPFDPACGQFEHLVRFLDMDVSGLFTEYKFQGIPCFVATFGTDAELAHNAIRYVLAKTFGYPPSAEFTCQVYDEGPLEKAGRYQAPRGGWGPGGDE